MLNNGTRIQMHPATDRWMRGDRYGEIVGKYRPRGGEMCYKVKMDRSGDTVVVHPENVQEA